MSYRKIPPTDNPSDCICGGASGRGGPRCDIVCPCCDGRTVVFLPAMVSSRKIAVPAKDGKYDIDLNDSHGKQTPE